MSFPELRSPRERGDIGGVWGCGAGCVNSFSPLGLTELSGLSTEEEEEERDRRERGRE